MVTDVAEIIFSHEKRRATRHINERFKRLLIRFQGKNLEISEVTPLTHDSSPVIFRLRDLWQGMLRNLVVCKEGQTAQSIQAQPLKPSAL